MRKMQEHHSRQMELMSAKMEGIKIGQGSQSSGGYDAEMKLGKPPELKAAGENWEEFAFKLKGHVATKDQRTAELLTRMERPKETQCNLEDLSPEDQSRSQTFYPA